METKNDEGVPRKTTLARLAAELDLSFDEFRPFLAALGMPDRLGPQDTVDDGVAEAIRRFVPEAKAISAWLDLLEPFPPERVPPRQVATRRRSASLGRKLGCHTVLVAGRDMRGRPFIEVQVSEDSERVRARVPKTLSGYPTRVQFIPTMGEACEKRAPAATS